MSRNQLINNIKNEIQTIDSYVYSYENVKLPSGRKCVVSINVFQTKLDLLINACEELCTIYPEIFSPEQCKELKDIQLEDISHARYKCIDTKEEYEQVVSIWREIKLLLEPIINN